MSVSVEWRAYKLREVQMLLLGNLDTCGSCYSYMVPGVTKELAR